jgi:hypothetical protein
VPFVVHGYEMKQAHIDNSSHLLATKLPNVLKQSGEAKTCNLAARTHLGL